MKKCISTLTTILILLAPIYAWAATYYVGQKSAGAGNGMYYANRMSVSTHNFSNFEPGDIIFLCDTITTQVWPPSSGTSGHAITYKGDYAGHAALIRVTGESQLRFDGIDYLTFDGIKFDGQNESADFGILSCGSSDHIIIKNCWFEEQRYKGIAMWYKSNAYNGAATPAACTYWTVGGADGDGNTFYNIGGSTAAHDLNMHYSNNLIFSYNKCYSDSEVLGRSGIVIEDADHALIEYNEFYGHYAEDGIGGKNASYVIVRYNTIHDHDGQNGAGGQGSGINMAFSVNPIRPCRNWYVYGNVSYNNDKHGILVMYGATNINIWSNVIYNNGYAGIAVLQYSGASTVKIYNNTIIDSGGSNTNGLYHQIYINATAGAIIKNNIFYHSQKASQVYIGSSTANVTMDYNHYYYTGGTPTVHWGGRNYNWNSVPGQEANATTGNPNITNVPGSVYTLLGTSPCKDTGADLSGLVGSVTIHGTTHNMYWDDGLDDSYWDWNNPYLKVKTVDQTLYGSWEKGAYVFTGDEPPSIITPTGLKLKVSQE